jgi:ribosomal protein L6P/L9E
MSATKHSTDVDIVANTSVPSKHQEEVIVVGMKTQRVAVARKKVKLIGRADNYQRRLTVGRATPRLLFCSIGWW